MENTKSEPFLNIQSLIGDGIVFSCSNSLPLTFAMEVPSYLRRSLSCLIRLDQEDMVGTGKRQPFIF